LTSHRRLAFLTGNVATFLDEPLATMEHEGEGKVMDVRQALSARYPEECGTG
jgi:hypothetical protein